MTAKQTYLKQRQTIRGFDNPPPVFNARLKEAFLLFMEEHPAGTLSRSLRNMFIEYLMEPSTRESEDLYETLCGLETLFMLLDVIEDEAHEVVLHKLRTLSANAPKDQAPKP